MQVDVSEENENAEEEAYIVENPTLVMNISRYLTLVPQALHHLPNLNYFLNKNILDFRTLKLSQVATMEWQNYHV
jgi:hypothetical protein